MRDYLFIGPAPCEEQCVQVTKDGNYGPAMRAECRRFIELIRRVLGHEPEGARLAVMRQDHDFGPYFEVVCYYDTDMPESVEYAYKCERNAPSRWDTPSASMVDLDALQAERLSPPEVEGV